MSTYLASSKSPCGIGRIPWRTAAGAGLGGDGAHQPDPLPTNATPVEMKQRCSRFNAHQTQRLRQRKCSASLGMGLEVTHSYAARGKGQARGKGHRGLAVEHFVFLPKMHLQKKHLGTGQCHTRGRPLNPNKWNETEAPSGSAAPPPAFHCREEFGGGTHPSSGSAMFN